MMAYIGCALFGLVFLLMAAKTSGSLGARMDETFLWMHKWAPFSYIFVVLLLLAPIVSLKIVHSWPKRVEPEDPMAKYRRAEDVVED